MWYIKSFQEKVQRHRKLEVLWRTFQIFLFQWHWCKCRYCKYQSYTRYHTLEVWGYQTPLECKSMCQTCLDHIWAKFSCSCRLWNGRPKPTSCLFVGKTGVTWYASFLPVLLNFSTIEYENGSCTVHAVTRMDEHWKMEVIHGTRASSICCHLTRDGNWNCTPK